MFDYTSFFALFIKSSNIFCHTSKCRIKHFNFICSLGFIKKLNYFMWQISYNLPFCIWDKSIIRFVVIIPFKEIFQPTWITFYKIYCRHFSQHNFSKTRKALKLPNLYPLVKNVYLIYNSNYENSDLRYNGNRLLTCNRIF